MQSLVIHHFSFCSKSQWCVTECGRVLWKLQMVTMWTVARRSRLPTWRTNARGDTDTHTRCTRSSSSLCLLITWKLSGWKLSSFLCKTAVTHGPIRHTLSLGKSPSGTYATHHLAAFTGSPSIHSLIQCKRVSSPSGGSTSLGWLKLGVPFLGLSCLICVTVHLNGSQIMGIGIYLGFLWVLSFYPLLSQSPVIVLKPEHGSHILDSRARHGS